MIATGIHALVQRAQQGDKDAWGQLVARLRPELVRYAERLVGRGPSFEDLTHDVLLRAWDWLPSFEGGSGDDDTTRKLLAALHTTTQRLYLNGQRKKPPTPPLRVATRPADDSTGANGVVEPAGKDPTPSKDFDAREKARFIQEALKSLSAQDRQIVELRFFEKWEYGQIGAHLGLDESTVRYHLQKCLKQLQPRLKGLMP